MAKKNPFVVVSGELEYKEKKEIIVNSIKVPTIDGGIDKQKKFVYQMSVNEGIKYNAETGNFVKTTVKKEDVLEKMVGDIEKGKNINELGGLDEEDQKYLNQAKQSLDNTVKNHNKALAKNGTTSITTNRIYKSSPYGTNLDKILK